VGLPIQLLTSANLELQVDALDRWNTLLAVGHTCWRKIVSSGGSLDELMGGMSSTIRDALFIDEESLCALSAAVDA
jgi:hypothetical protein